MEFENNNEMRKAYRDYMTVELARPEIKKAKRDLVAFFEAPSAPSASVLSATFLIPAFAILILFFSFQHLQSRVAYVAGPSEPVFRPLAVFGEEMRAREIAERQAESVKRTTERTQLLDDTLRDDVRPGVMVKRVSSRVGTTMVYQKVYGGTPVTIIWLFHRLPGAGLPARQGQASGGNPV